MVCFWKLVAPPVCGGRLVVTDGLQREVLQLFVQIPEDRGGGCCEGKCFSIQCHPSPQMNLGVLSRITLKVCAQTSGNPLYT